MQNRFDDSPCTCHRTCSNFSRLLRPSGGRAVKCTRKTFDRAPTVMNFSIQNHLGCIHSPTLPISQATISYLRVKFPRKSNIQKLVTCVHDRYSFHLRRVIKPRYLDQFGYTIDPRCPISCSVVPNQSDRSHRTNEATIKASFKKFK